MGLGFHLRTTGAATPIHGHAVKARCGTVVTLCILSIRSSRGAPRGSPWCCTCSQSVPDQRTGSQREVACTQISVAAGIPSSRPGSLPVNLARCIWLQLEGAKWLYNYVKKNRASIYIKFIVFRRIFFFAWIILSDPLSNLERPQRPGLEFPPYGWRNHGLKGLLGSFSIKILRDGVKTWTEVSHPLPWTFPT